jgi:membrane protein implicated in regulation of membrane protease activity
MSIEELWQGPAVAARRRMFETLDADAIAAQTQFKQEMSRANLAIALAALCGGLLLAAGIFAGAVGGGGPWSWVQWLPTPLGIAGGLAGVLGSMWLFRARQGERLKRWMNRRAAAESARRAMYVELVKAQPLAPADPIAVASGKLDFILKDHVEDQRNWYDRRSREHRESADRSLSIGGVAVGLGALASFAAGAAATAHPIYAALGTFSVIGAALATFATTREEIQQDRRNAERYENARDALDDLLGKVGDVRDTIEKGSTEALSAFVVAVHEQLLAEHRQWLQGQERREAVIGQLEEALSKLRQTAAADEAPSPAAPSQ